MKQLKLRTDPLFTLISKIINNQGVIGKSKIIFLKAFYTSENVYGKA